MNEKKYNKIKQDIKDFFKDPKEVISFFLPMILIFCLIIPVPYYIKLGGGTIKIDNKISIKDSHSNSNKGSFEALCVKEAKGVVLTYLLSYVVPSYEREKIEDVTLESEDEEDYSFRERLYFTSSLDAATKVAFQRAGREVKIKESNFLVLYIDKNAKTDLKTGDVVRKIEGKRVSNYEEISNIVGKKQVNDKVIIEVKRGKRIVETKTTLIELEGAPKLGIVLSNQIKYESNPKVDFDFNGNQAGPSGGLMVSLSIYNKLVDEDITKGRRIAGTGTIDLEGNVGEIGGVKYKLMAAGKKKADIVLVPKANYKEALNEKKKNNYKFKLISVDNFDDAIEKLK